MTQTQFVGAPQGAIWGYDPTTNLWLPIGASPKLVGPNGEIYGSLLVNVSNANANGQAIMANSAPVVLASDQSPVATKSPAWTNIYTTTQTGVSTWGGSGDLAVGTYDQLMINYQVTAITGTSAQFITKRKDSFNNYYSIDSPAALTAVGGQNRSIGWAASINAFFGTIAQITVTFVAITSISFTVDVWAR